MYLNFYGLAEKPFNATPDPRFLYLTSGSSGGARPAPRTEPRSAKGFIVLTGKVGTGKTTLLHALRQRLDGTNARSPTSSTRAVVRRHPRVRPGGPRNRQARGIAGAAPHRAEQLPDRARARRPEHRAHHRRGAEPRRRDAGAGPAALELRDPYGQAPADPAGRAAGAQGQARPAGAAAAQAARRRCAARSRRSPRTRPRQYIRTRLRIAGARDLGIFPTRRSTGSRSIRGGIPRLINILCDHCLLFGYAEQKHRIDRTAVDQAIEYLEEGMATRGRVLGLGGRVRSRWRWFRATSVLALAVVAAVGILLTFEPDVLDLVQSLRSGVLP